jgi:hypothetical protein
MITQEIYSNYGTQRFADTLYHLITAEIIEVDTAATIIRLTEPGLVPLDWNSPTIQGGWPPIAPFDGAPVAQVDRITLSGGSGTAYVTCNGLTKTATYGTDLPTTAAAFVTAFATAYALIGVTLTSSGSDLIFTAAQAGIPFIGAPNLPNMGNTPLLTTCVNTGTGNLAGTCFHLDTVTLTGSTGTFPITAGGLTETCTWTTDTTTSANNFVSSWSAAYTAIGITVTAASGVITFKIPVGMYTGEETNVGASSGGTLNGTVALTSNRTTPIGWHNIAGVSLAAGTKLFAKGGLRFSGIQLSAGAVRCY